jgi:hypothetical protein
MLAHRLWRAKMGPLRSPSAERPQLGVLGVHLKQRFAELRALMFRKRRPRAQFPGARE